MMQGAEVVAIVPLHRVVALDLSTDGLNPFTCRIVGITVKTLVEEQIFTERDEKVLLEQFWSYVKEKKFARFVTFNGSQFDLKMLMLRSVKHKINVMDIRDNHIDLREAVFGNLENHKVRGKLSDFQEFLGVIFPQSGYQKMHMSLLWDDKARHLSSLREFLLRDVKLTWTLYEHLIDAGLV